MCCWCCLETLNETSWDPPFHWYIKHIRMHAYIGVSTYTGPGQFLGGSILPPLVTNSNTSWLLRLGYGMYPREKISHSKTPKDLQEADDRIRTGHNKKGGIWEGVPEGFLPRICFWCKDSLHEGLGRHPLDRQHGSATLPVIARPKTPVMTIIRVCFMVIQAVLW